MMKKFSDGVKSISKKDAKKSCAIRLLDRLMMEQKLDCINTKGRKLRRSSRLNKSIDAVDMDFSADVNLQEVYFYHLFVCI